MGDYGVGFMFSVLKKSVFAGLTCMFSLGGAVVGTISGAITGQTTETGFCRGAGIGAVAGAIVAIELLESLIDGNSLSQIAMLGSLVNGKIFREWVSPAMLKAYQWQDFEEGQSAKRLPSCRHFFHEVCVDGWLVIQGTCPVCRQDV
ncbi:hypothetical protein GIB67_011489 [Kingdonia uniflora]|uniref:RING-type domain-containing protein n=1 Tax=Kingdonia uniflora TaxID=39325 RepID=A0A7J7NM92_9MAGN|nr:hypothetical protein GIB67_011489 [Kingdonia uniflora]